MSAGLRHNASGVTSRSDAWFGDLPSIRRRVATQIGTAGASCPIFAALAIILCGCAQLDYSVESTASSPPLLTTGNVSRPIGDSALDSDLPRRTTIALRDRSLSLGAALALVQAENADLIASAAGVAAVGARQIDAGKLTNPEASIYVEDIGFRPETQTTLQLSQALPLTAKLGPPAGRCTRRTRRGPARSRCPPP